MEDRRKGMEKANYNPEGFQDLSCPVHLEHYSSRNLKEELYAEGFNCGHTSSRKASKVMRNCPKCKTVITTRARVFALDGVGEAVEQLESKLAATEKLLVESQQERATRDTEQKELRAELTNSHQAVVALRADLKTTKAELAASKKEASEAQQKWSESEKKASYFEHKLAQAQQERELIHRGLQEAQRLLSELRTEINAKEEETRALHRQLSEVRHLSIEYRQLVEETEALLGNQAKSNDAFPDKKHSKTHRSSFHYHRAPISPAGLFRDKSLDRKASEFFDAIKSRNIPLFKRMLANNPDLIHVRLNGKGRTPLMLAAGLHYLHAHEMKQILEELHKAGADINYKDRAGNTALHLAAKRNDHEGVKYLLEKYNADRTLRNNANQTPAAVAEAYNFVPASVEVIKGYLAGPASISRSRACC